MNVKALDREVALRIGLAARELEGVDTGALMNVLVAHLAMPLTLDKLDALTIRDLREADEVLFHPVSNESLKKAMECLWGRSGVAITDIPLPAVKPYSEGDMPGSIRVAIASNNGEKLDGHFGSCLRFLIYQVSGEEVRLIDIREINPSEERAEEKNTYRSKLIGDCELLYVVSIGGPAAAKVVKEDVHPIKHPSGGDASVVLCDLQQVLQGTPPPWLAKVMGHGAEERVRFQREEEEA